MPVSRGRGDAESSAQVFSPCRAGQPGLWGSGFVPLYQVRQQWPVDQSGEGAGYFQRLIKPPLLESQPVQRHGNDRVGQR